MSDDLIQLQKIIFLLTQMNNIRFMNRRLQLELDQMSQNQILQENITNLLNKIQPDSEGKNLEQKSEEIKHINSTNNTNNNQLAKDDLLQISKEINPIEIIALSDNQVEKKIDSRTREGNPNEYEKIATNEIKPLNNIQIKKEDEVTNSPKKIPFQKEVRIKKNNKFLIRTDQIKIPGEKTKYYKCNLCEKIFPKESNFKDHMRTHTGEKPFVCSFEDCQKTFSQLGNLKKHETVHYGEKAFICEHPGCEKGFSALYNLKIHQRSHSGEKPYRCLIENCNREFYDKGNLKYHEKTAHSLYMKLHRFSCDHLGCNMKFKTRNEKLAHHYEMEPICQNEMKTMIFVISSFKKFLIRLFSHCKIDKEYLEKDAKYLDLKQSYLNLLKSLVGPQDLSILEENFETNGKTNFY